MSSPGVRWEPTRFEAVAESRTGPSFTVTPHVCGGVTTNTASGSSTVLSPEEAFAVLGHKARLDILQALGGAEEPLAYSELFERIDYDDRSNYSYHLDRLAGHFVDKVGEGYVLRRPGERVLEAVHSGAVTTDPVRALTQTERPCPFCSAAIEVGYEQERVTMHCPECSGLFERADPEDSRLAESGNLGFRPLPSAAVDGRTAAEIHDVSKTWTALTVHAMSRGVCPRCSGASEHSVAVCESHDASEGLCAECGWRFGAAVSADCTNCIFDFQVGVAAYLATSTEVMAFLIEHGIDPVAPGEFHPYAALEETVLSHDPFEAQYTVTVDDDTLVATVDKNLSVVETAKR